MKVTDMRTVAKFFEQIKTGQCFMIDNQVFIKVGYFNEEEHGEVFNCVCLNDGSFYYASDDDAIELITAEIIVR